MQGGITSEGNSTRCIAHACCFDSRQHSVFVTMPLLLLLLDAVRPSSYARFLLVSPLSLSYCTFVPPFSGTRYLFCSPLIVYKVPCCSPLIFRPFFSPLTTYRFIIYPGTFSRAPYQAPFCSPRIIYLVPFLRFFSYMCTFLFARSVSSAPAQIDDADLLGAPPQRPRGDQGVCRKIMGFFGFY